MKALEHTARQGSTPRAAARPSASEPSTHERGFRLRTILVPTDFSPHSEKALAYAISMGKTFGAQITLIGVDETPYDTMVLHGLVDIDELKANCDRRLLKQLNALVDRFGKPLMNATPIVENGHAATKIVEAARKLGTDLIVIGTHGYTGLKHMVIGSTAENVVRHAPCPVCRRPNVSPTSNLA